MPRLRKWSESEKQLAMPDFKTCKKKLAKKTRRKRENLLSSSISGKGALRVFHSVSSVTILFFAPFEPNWNIFSISKRQKDVAAGGLSPVSKRLLLLRFDGLAKYSFMPACCMPYLETTILRGGRQLKSHCACMTRYLPCHTQGRLLNRCWNNGMYRRVRPRMKTRLSFAVSTSSSSFDLSHGRRKQLRRRRRRKDCLSHLHQTNKAETRG